MRHWAPCGSAVRIRLRRVRLPLMVRYRQGLIAKRWAEAHPTTIHHSPFTIHYWCGWPACAG
ncbi:hypothetical protein PSEUDO9AG_10081 [Pseudomonas sp. 9Ag]|nr:hypothetical protein PSEUDO9AG_10081 [Pseudomonas sp. 9Ag]